MRLNKIIEARKEFENASISEILQRYCKKAGIRTGNFSIVVIPENKPYVYKFWIKDTGYESFLNLRSDIGPNVYSYKTLQISIPKDEVSSIKFARIEKLVTMSSGSSWDHLYLDNCIIDTRTNIKYSLSKFYCKFSQELIDTIENSVSENIHIEKLLGGLPEIVRHGIQHGFGNDLRQANYALRPSGEIIVNDPYVCLEESKIITLAHIAGDTPADMDFVHYLQTSASELS